MTTKEQATIQVLKALFNTVLASGPLGAPGGVMYAALMGQGCTLQQFEGLMNALLRTRLVRKVGDCYHAN
jgi:hypothetical protein